jgi:hypothetical protein
MIDLLLHLYDHSYFWTEDEEFTIERLRKWRSNSTLLKLEFLSSLSLNLSVTPARYYVKITLDQQEKRFEEVDEKDIYHFVKFLSKPKRLLC